MLQIIGLTVCICLLVKSIEMIGGAESTTIVKVGGWVGVVGFFLSAWALIASGSAASGALSGASPTSSYDVNAVMSEDQNLTEADMNATDPNMTISADPNVRH